MELKMVNDKGGAGTFKASDDVFARDFNESLVHQIVVAYQANARIGSRRARERGGGKIFPNSPDENFSHKVNRKMFRAGIASILSQLAREDRIRVVEQFSVD